MKVIALTWGDLARAADEKDGKTTYSDNPYGDIRLNCKESAEVIVPSGKYQEKKEAWTGGSLPQSRKADTYGSQLS
jgi:hypothetical protein